MQKKLIALAIAGLAAAPAFAADNVTIYGILDEGLVFSGGDSGKVTNTKSRHALDNGVLSPSRLGFKGAEDLGNGIKAIFEIETGLQMDRANAGTTVGQAGGLFSTSRHSYMGLTGGFGTFVAGRLDGVRYANYAKYDQSGAGTARNIASMVNQTDRADNAMAYISPSFSGFSVLLAYSANAGLTGLSAGTTDECVGNVGDGRLLTAQLNYDNGPLSASLDHEEIEQQKLAAPQKYKTSNVGALYDFGVAKVGLFYDKNTLDVPGARLVDYNVWIASVSAPVGANAKVFFSYGSVDDKTVANQDGRKWGIGAQYNMSKRTTLYTDFGQINNRNNGGYVMQVAGNAGAVPGLQAASNGTANYGVRALDLGIRHSF